MQEHGAWDVVNRKKIKFEPYNDIVDQEFSQFNENSIKSQDRHRQIQTNETPEAKYLNANDS